jgi:hypothetical protein
VSRSFRHVSYANVMSTLAMFIALGGGAWAASGGLVSASGRVRGCVPRGGGVLTVVRPNARCKRGHEAVALASRALVGPAGTLGPVGPPGLQGPAGPGAVAFSMGPTSAGPEQIVTAPFGSNQMRLSCGKETCTAQIAVSGNGTVLGTDQRGSEHADVTKTTMTTAQTPAIVALTAASGAHSQSEGHATLLLDDGTSWRIDVDLLTDASGNVRLIGTAVPSSATAPDTLLCSAGHGACPAG